MGVDVLDASCIVTAQVGAGAKGQSQDSTKGDCSCVWFCIIDDDCLVFFF